MDEKIKEIVDKLIERGHDENEPLILLLKNTELKWDNPEQVFCLHCFTNEQNLRNVLKLLYPESDDVVLSFLFQHYDFVEHQIQSVLSDLSTDGGLCDKSRWVLKQWFNELTGKEVENIAERKEYHPDFGHVNLWIQLCEVSMNIYYKGCTLSNMDFMKIMNKMAMEVLDGRHQSSVGCEDNATCSDETTKFNI